MSNDQDGFDQMDLGEEVARLRRLYTRVTATVVVLLVLTVVGWTCAVKTRAKRAQYWQAAASRAVGHVHSFMQDIGAERFDAAAALGTQPLNTAHWIKGETREFRESPLVSEGFVLVYKWVNQGVSNWRVDAELVRRDGKKFFGQFDLVDQSDGSVKIYRWGIVDWPANPAFQLGDAGAKRVPGTVEWSPWGRNVFEGRRQ